MLLHFRQCKAFLGIVTEELGENVRKVTCMEKRCNAYFGDEVFDLFREANFPVVEAQVHFSDSAIGA